MEIEFVPELPPAPDPPKVRRHMNGEVTSLVGVAKALKANPGQWALVDTYPPQKKRLAHLHACKIRRGRRYDFGPDGSFEAVTRSLPGELSVQLYARYVGPVIKEIE